MGFKEQQQKRNDRVLVELLKKQWRSFLTS